MSHVVTPALEAAVVAAPRVCLEDVGVKTCLLQRALKPLGYR